MTGVLDTLAALWAEPANRMLGALVFLAVIFALARRATLAAQRALTSPPGAVGPAAAFDFTLGGRDRPRLLVVLTADAEALLIDHTEGDMDVGDTVLVDVATAGRVTRRTPRIAPRLYVVDVSEYGDENWWHGDTFRALLLPVESGEPSP